ncbi:MAG: hypothetical protein JNM10_17495 [Planctomycetia bacterium]|nr:hypothetical protein [Planctomycetia bacterium]
MVRPWLGLAVVLASGGFVYVLARPATHEVGPPDAIEPLAEAPEPEASKAQEIALASAGRVAAERRERERVRLEAAWAAVLRLQQEGRTKAALEAARRLKADHPGLFDDPAKAAVLDRLAVAVEAAAKRAELEKLLAGARVSPEQREAVNAKLAATAEVLAKSGNEDDLDQLSRHLRRFLVPGLPSGGEKGSADLLLNTFLQDRRARRGKDTLPPVADLTEAERRRVDQLDKLRQRNAVGLLDAIHAGLAWLALHQRDDGSFSDTAVVERCTALKHDPACLTAAKRDSTGDAYATAATALAVLAFLDFRDQDPNGWFDPYLGRGIEWLRKLQKPDGSFPGGGQMYAGAMALMALGQAAASTGSPELRESVRKGLAYFDASMGPLGGYRYRPLDPTGDLSVTAWVAQATEAARLADVQVPFRVSSGLEIFLGYFWKGTHKFSYVPTGGPSASLAPAGMLVAHVAGKGADPAVAASWRAYLKGLPANRPPSLYTLYYGVRLSILLDGALEDPWRAWAFDLTKQQLGSGSAAGCFPVAVHGAERATGLATQTALAVLTLEHALYLR